MEKIKREDLKSWGDLASRYTLVLFNNVTKVEGVLEEWHESHLENCEAEQMRYKLEDLQEVENPTEEQKKEIADIVNDWGEYPSCECEPYQWYIIDTNESEVEFLNKEFGLGIFESDILDLYILPVYHFGTSWGIMGLKGGYVNL